MKTTTDLFDDTDLTAVAEEIYKDEEQYPVDDLDGDGAAFNEELDELDRDEDELLEKKRELLKEMHSNYRAGSISKKEYAQFMCDVLERYIQKMIYITKVTKFRTNNSFEDFLQEGKLAIIQKIDEYDPEKGMPTTYFKDYIRGAFNKLVKSPSENGRTVYYNQCVTLIKKVLAERKISANDPNVSVRDIQRWMNEPKNKNPYSLRTIEQAWKSMPNNIVSYEALLEGDGTEYRSERPIMDIESSFVSPEDYVLNKELNDIILQNLDSITPLQKFILFKTEFVDAPTKLLNDEYTSDTGSTTKDVSESDAMSYRDLINLLSTPRYMEEFSDELEGVKLTPMWLRQYKNSAFRKLKYYRDFQRYNNVTQTDFFVQASTEDIDVFLMDDKDAIEII